jgi:cob(I)alamin adenosyltransferase
MKIYTKTGDTGDTSLFGGERVSKHVLRVEAYGTIDELNATLGMVASDELPADVRGVILEIQKELFALGADIATPPAVDAPAVRRMQSADAGHLEKAIDLYDGRLEPLRNFILPGGTQAAAKIHVSRTVCRRAERAVVRLAHADEVGQGCIVYLNRLSDLLFVLARYANAAGNVPDVIWKP